MLLVALTIAVVWLATMALVVGLCVTAARGDARTQPPRRTRPRARLHPVA